MSFFFTQGLRFLHFPYLLTLQLKRFDFDYTTMHRIKLNDRMTFPEELDMSPFIDVEDEVSATIDARIHQIYVRLICHQNFVAFVYFDNLQISQ